MNWHEKRIGLLLGGLSPERPVSLRSGAAMAAALERKGYQVVSIDAGRDLPQRLVEERIEVAVLALHGEFGEDGVVQGILEGMGIPYTGSGVTASALCMDKELTKKVFLASGLPTPAWESVTIDAGGAVEGALEQLAGMELPVFVKPARAGSSIGINRATTREELKVALTAAAVVESHIVVEREVRGAEVTLGVLEGQALPALEIRPTEGYYDYTNKYTAGRTSYLIPPPDLTAATLERIAWLGEAAYRAVGCRGLARIDFMVDGGGEPWLLEVNTIPGMTATSLAPKAAAAVGIDFDTLVERILHGARLGACGAPS